MRSQPFLELGQHQQLALTPQLRQALRLLHCSAVELDQALAEAVADNPLLEQVDPSDAAARAEWLERRWAQPTGFTVSDDIPEPVDIPSLSDHLLQQLHTTRASERDRFLAALLIGELDERGYLAEDVVTLGDTLLPGADVEAEEWRAALRLVQSFDPTGVAAMDLADCLRLQLRARAEEWPAGVVDCAMRLSGHLEDLGVGRWGRLCRTLGCDRPLLEAARQALLRLDPRPVRAWDTAQVHYVVPDVLFHKVRGEWAVSPNPARQPRLRINPALESCLRDSDASPEMQERLREARGLVRGLDQRQQTILRVAEVVARRQRGFLEKGEAGLRPLVLREVAEALDLHESTISRATRLKYAQTPWGIFELKRFFATAVRAGGGEDTSAAAIQAVMRTLLDGESAGKPLSDMRLTQLLAERGVVVARRTVAKYREAMGVPTASLRKHKAAGVTGP